MAPLTPESTPAPSTENSLQHLADSTTASTGDQTDEMNSPGSAAAPLPLVDVPIVVDEVNFTFLVVCRSFFISDTYLGTQLVRSGNTAEEQHIFGQIRTQ